MNYRRYIRLLFLIFLSILLFLIIFNILIDPFDIFHVPKIKKINYIKPDKARNERVTKIVGLKLEKGSINSVFLGSSRVNSSISEEYFKKISKKTAKNMGMNALSHDETFKIANNIILIHPEVKTIYVGLDFFRFLEENKDNKRNVNLSDTKKLTVTELNPLVLSFNTIQASFNTLRDNLRYRDTKIKVDKGPYFKKKLADYKCNYNNAKLAVSEIEKLKNFKSEMEQKGYKVVYYTNPTHVLDLSLIKQMGYWDVYKAWKRNLAQRFDYIDFNFVNDKTAEPVDENTEYFLESSHSTKKMGEVIIDNLISKNNDYGINITKGNVRKIEILNEQELEKWEKSNPDWVIEIKGILKNDI